MGFDQKYGTGPAQIPMGYGLWERLQFLPLNGVGNWKNLWDMGEYGSREVWVRRELTVN